MYLFIYILSSTSMEYKSHSLVTFPYILNNCYIQANILQQFSTALQSIKIWI
jgi:hypothetical protein